MDNTKYMLLKLFSLVFVLSGSLGAALSPIPKPEPAPGSLEITSLVMPGRPFTVAGEHGAIFGRQNGKFEAWIWPVKILSDFRIRAELGDYAVPIDVNLLAAQIKVTPAETVITYSHAAFTIKQHMFAVRREGTPIVSVAAFFELSSLRPMEITFSFTPEMLKMWPAPNFGRPNSEWVQRGDDGAYILHTDNPDFSAVVAMPRTKPGILVPYQEHPQTYPTELKLSYDPKRDAGVVFPLVMTMADKTNAVQQATNLIGSLPQAYSETQAYYQKFFEKRMTVETPDKRIDEALKWAEISIDQSQVAHGDETGLVAGYYESADSARPGYAWFFGRDTLFTTYAVNSYGDFGLTRRALDFLIKRQRNDGKIMHEYSQSAESIDWKRTPYFYASADSTPLFVMAMWDYVRSSGDLAYLKKNWQAVEKAWEFTCRHEDADGIYSNSEGTGWVESWPPGMPKKEIYLASLDEQSAEAMSRLAQAMNDPELSSNAYKQSGEIANRIESEYFDAKDSFYAFSVDDKKMDTTASIYPSVAWWDGTFRLNHVDKMFSRWASSEFSTDWGTRDISPKTPFYDAISYHQGSIWPLFTGWVSLAEYRAHRPLSAFSHLMQNVNLTWDQDLGSITELLSGEYYQPLGRSSSHQLWSSAMVITPMIRGLFGLDWDASTNMLRVTPNLPAEWERATVSNVALGDDRIDLDFEKSGDKLLVRTRSQKARTLCLTTDDPSQSGCKSKPANFHTMTVALPVVELGVNAEVPSQGAITSGLKVVSEETTGYWASFVLSAPGKTVANLPVKLHKTHVTVDGGTLIGGSLRVVFPEGAGYQERTVRFTW
jgi:glycogen debranching enzyme